MCCVRTTLLITHYLFAYTKTYLLIEIFVEMFDIKLIVLFIINELHINLFKTDDAIRKIKIGYLI